MKVIELDWHNFFVKDANISTLIQCVYIIVTLNCLRLVQNM